MTSLHQASNPGANQIRKLPGPRRFFINLYASVRRREIKKAWHYALSQGGNYLNTLARPFLSTSYFCPCCGKFSKYFFHLSNSLEITWHSACPHCDSRSRHRGQLIFFKDYFKQISGGKKSLLHFAPEPVLSEFFRTAPNLQYQTADLILKDVDHPNLDIRETGFQSNQFDFVICNHVLEHVDKDQKALHELYRILKPGGTAFVSVPGDFRQLETLEFNTPDGNGHYRHYGLDFKQRCAHFNDVTTLDLHKFHRIKKITLSIKNPEILFICRK